MAVSHCKEWGNDPVEKEQTSAHPLVHLRKIINLAYPYLDCACCKGDPGRGCSFEAVGRVLGAASPGSAAPGCAAAAGTAESIWRNTGLCLLEPASAVQSCSDKQ